MSFELRPFGKEQTAEAAKLVADSFTNNPFRKLLFPSGTTGAVSIDSIRQELIRATDDEDDFLIQLWDTESNRMAAFALWLLTKSMTEETWDQQLQDRIAMYPDARQDVLLPFLKMENEAKRKVMGMGRWWELEMLNVHPDFQRKGLGSRLMSWGDDELNKRKVPSVIVSTVQGYGLYAKHGWETQEKYFVDLNKIGGQGQYFNAVMTKFPKSES